MALLIVVAGCSTAPAEPPADLLVTNARIYAADGAGTLHEALAVRGDRIAAVGRAADLERLRGAATRVVDAGGRSVVPGFNDTHLHLFEGGRAAERADLGEAATVEEVQSRLREFAAGHPAASLGARRGLGLQHVPGRPADPGPARRRGAR